MALAAIVYSVRHVDYKRIIWLLVMSNFHSLIYQGIGLSLSTVVHTWGLHLKGPVYVSIFKPLSDCQQPLIAVVIYVCHIPWMFSILGGIQFSLTQASERACMHERYKHIAFHSFGTLEHPNTLEALKNNLIYVFGSLQVSRLHGYLQVKVGLFRTFIINWYMHSLLTVIQELR